MVHSKLTSKRAKKFVHKKKLAPKIANDKKQQKRNRDFAEVDDKREKRLAEEKAKAEEAAKEKDEYAKSVKVEDMDVDQLLSGKFLNDSDDEEPEQDTSLADPATDDDEESSKVTGNAMSDSDDEELSEGSDFEDEASHREQLLALAKKDPEFYKMLAEEDSSLLNFESDKEEDEDSPAGAGDAVSDGKQKKSKTKKKEEEDGEKEEVPVHETKDSESQSSYAALRELQRRALEDKSSKATVRLLRLFKTAVHLQDAHNLDNQEKKGGSNKKRKLNEGLSADVDDELASGLNAKPRMYASIMNFSFKKMGLVFDGLLGRVSSTEDGAVPKSVKSFQKWEKVQHYARSYLMSLVHFLNTSVDPTLVRFALSQSEQVMAYVVPFKLISKKILKVLVEIWSTHNDQNIRIDAFLRIRQLVLEMPPQSEFLESALKACYLAYVRNAKFITVEYMSTVIFMSNCVVELYQIDFEASYQHAFVYIRQLAIHLRNATISAAKDSHHTVYNWQFVNCLRVWGAVLSLVGTDTTHDLEPLIYPYIQVCLGSLSLVASLRYAPLKLHVIRFINELCEETQVYVPLAPSILSILQHKEFEKAVTNSRGHAKLKYAVKVAENVINTKGFQTQIFTETMTVLEHYLRIFSFSVAFPEMIIPIVLALKKFKKNAKFPAASKAVNAFIQKLDMNATFIKNQRVAVEATPKKLMEGKLNFEDMIRQRPKQMDIVTPLQRFNAGGEAIERKTTASLAMMDSDASDDSGADSESAMNSDVDEDEEEAEAAININVEDDDAALQDKVEEFIMSDSD